MEHRGPPRGMWEPLGPRFTGSGSLVVVVRPFEDDTRRKLPPVNDNGDIGRWCDSVSELVKHRCFS